MVHVKGWVNHTLELSTYYSTNKKYDWLLCLLKYFSSDINTWKTIFHDCSTTGTNDEMWSD